MNKQAYEAPKAVVVDFDNEYVAAAHSIGQTDLSSSQL